MSKIEFFDKINDKAKFLAIAKERGFNMDNFFDSSDKMFQVILRKAENKDLDAKSYVRIEKESEEQMEKYWIYFKDEEAFFNTLKEIDPENAENRITHEKLHLEKIRKYGLVPNFLIIADSEIKEGWLNYRPLVALADLVELAEKSDWDLKKIIETVIDLADIEDKSDSDIKTIESLKKILSKIEEE